MINSLLTLGKNALTNYQVGLSVTGGNIANASTSGYTLRTVNYETVDEGNSSIGLGSSIQSIARKFDAYLERRYQQQISSTYKASTISTALTQVESLFTDSDDTGISTAMDSFLTSLSSLSTTASNSAIRSELIGSAEQLAEELNTISSALQTQVDDINSEIASQVDDVNSLLKQLAKVNSQIGSASESSGLYDTRDELLRELATYLDIDSTIADDGSVRVTTAEGQTLVDGPEAYSLTVGAPKVTTQLSTTSSFDGQLYFEGTSSNEFTVKFVTGGDCSGTSNAATFQVSLDGGKTWVTDADGKTATFKAGDVNNKVEVDGVSLWFGTADDENATPATDISAGDSFDVMPKTGLYWVTTTGGLVNVTPLSGNDTSNRLTGGTLAGLFASRDEYIGQYQDQLDAYSSSLIWNVNRLHSQGAGLTNMSQVDGEYAVDSTTKPLSESGLAWQDYLESGNISIALYDSSTGDYISTTALDFSSINPPGISNFDPTQHSLEDVASAINSTYSGQLTATISDGKLSIEAADGVSFQFAEDSSGLLAGLGINTFYSGTDASTIAVSSVITNDSSRICAGKVDASGAVNISDNSTATALAALATKSVSFAQAGNTTSDTLSGYLNSLVAQVGEDTSTAATNYSLASALAEDVNTQRESVSGVSMDEELTKLMQYQQCYQAAAKLITTANEMFDTILSLKS